MAKKRRELSWMPIKLAGIISRCGEKDDHEGIIVPLVAYCWMV